MTDVQTYAIPVFLLFIGFVQLKMQILHIRRLNNISFIMKIISSLSRSSANVHVDSTFSSIPQQG